MGMGEYGNSGMGEFGNSLHSNALMFKYSPIPQVFLLAQPNHPAVSGQEKILWPH